MKSIRVAAAVIEDGGRIFATQRGYGDYKGWWEFPGGKIEQRESPQQALRREIEEELDTEIDVGDLVASVEYDYPKFHLSMDCFWCKVKKGDLKLNEALQSRWLSKDDLFSVKWLPADMEVLDAISKAL